MEYAKFADARVTRITEGPKAGTEVRLLSHNEEMTIVHNVRPAGAVFPPHAHPAAQVYIIVKGKVELTVGEETRVLTDGDTWFVPSEVPHGARVLEDTVEYEVFVPGREDLAKTYG